MVLPLGDAIGGQHGKGHAGRCVHGRQQVLVVVRIEQRVGCARHDDAAGRGECLDLDAVDDGVRTHGEGVAVVDDALYLVYFKLVSLAIDGVELEGVYRGVGAEFVVVVRVQARTDGDGHDEKTYNDR